MAVKYDGEQVKVAPTVLAAYPWSGRSIKGRVLLAELKTDPGQVGFETLLREVDRLAAVRALRLPAGVFADSSEKLPGAWWARAVRLHAAPRPVRLTLLAALCALRASEITDARDSAGVLWPGRGSDLRPGTARPVLTGRLCPEVIATEA